ncbi:MAG: TetR/AcrR family transcriptional regulator [Bacteroidia bacterium]|nr:TetR/AcrR family transcriptional regulator [Bacteroidia bacterium]
MRYGIKSITMDDVARELAISKKTLYQYFSDKNDLVKKVLTHHLEIASNACKKTFEEITNPIDQMLVMSRERAEDMSNMNPALFYDLKKYYPESWIELEKYKTEFIYSHIIKNMQNGIEGGWYHSNIKTDIVAHIYVHLVDMMIGGGDNLKKQYNQKELHLSVINYHLHAVCTKKGLDHLNKRLTEMNHQ